MPPIDLAKIKAVLQESTPGPWNISEYWESEIESKDKTVGGEDGCMLVADAKAIVMMRNSIEPLMHELEAYREFVKQVEGMMERTKMPGPKVLLIQDILIQVGAPSEIPSCKT